MLKYRINNDFKFSIRLRDQVDLAEMKDVRVEVKSADGRVSFAPISVIDGNRIEVEVMQNQCSRYGKYDVKLTFGIPDGQFEDNYRDVELKACAAFAIVDSCSTEGCNDLLVIDTDAMYRGESAYHIARKNGFEGTEQEWLQSLKQASEDAAAEALLKAGQAEAAATLASQRAGEAHSAAQQASIQAGEAADATADAIEATQLTIDAILQAEVSAGKATAASISATDAAVAAGSAATSANNAASSASSAANNANTKAGEASTAANNATQKIQELNTWKNNFMGVTAVLASETVYDDITI